MRQPHFILQARLPLAALLTLCALLASAPVQAAGVVAGTLISNTAEATYTSGAASGTVSSNTVTVKVDELLDVAVAGTASSPVAVGTGNAVLPFNVTNTGNGGEAFKLTANSTVAGNQFDAVVQQIVLDNGNGIYEPGIDTVLAPGGSTPSLAPEATLKVFVVVTLPAGATDGQTSQLRLTAEAVTGTGTPGTSFAGAGQGGGDAVVGANGAQASGLDPMIAATASVGLVKSAVIADPYGGTHPVPGAVVTFSIVASVTGSGNATNLHVTDLVPAGTTYQAGTMKLDGAAKTDVSDADEAVFSAGTVDFSLGTVAGGTSHTVSFAVKIN